MNYGSSSQNCYFEMFHTLFSRFTEIFVSELEDTADLRILAVDYLKGLSPNAAIVDGIVRFVMQYDIFFFHV